MKYSKLLWALTFILVLIIVNLIHSSSMVDCDMVAKIIKVKTPFNIDKDRNYTCELELEFINIIREGGHVRNHGACQKFKKTKQTISFKDNDYNNVLTSDLIKENKLIVIKWKRVTNQGKKAITRWTIVGAPSKEDMIDYDTLKLKVFEDNEKYGYKDEKGNIIIPAKYIVADEFSDEGIASVIVDSEGWNIINKHGEVILKPFIFDNVPDTFEEGLARYVDNDKMGFYDKYGKIKIYANYDFAHSFVEGRASVCNGCTREYIGEHYIMVGGKWGFIDKEGKLVIDMIYKDAKYFSDGVAEVTTEDGEVIKIDKDGNVIK